MAKQKLFRGDNNTKVEELLSSACSKIKGMVDTNIIVGDKIVADNVTIIPLSKVSVGFVAGGGEYDKNPADEDFPFAGGSGAGFSVQPVGYLFVSGGEVMFTKIIPESPIEKVLDKFPEIVEKVNKALNK